VQTFIAIEAAEKAEKEKAIEEVRRATEAAYDSKSSSRWDHRPSQRHYDGV
jgi:hypothetical protein